MIGLRSGLALFVLIIPMLCASVCVAQSSSLPPRISAEKKSPGDDTPLTTFEEEIRAKRAIKLAEKEHEDNLKRAREISQISQDLRDSLKTAPLPKPDPKKVERLEKLTRKIRGEAGGEDDDVQIVNVPTDVPAAINQIADTADQLSKDVQKTPRQVISAAVIDRANVLLQLVKILRGFVH
jgi:hypothetical protein